LEVFAMAENELQFADRGAFRWWLEENGGCSDGVWLIFGKKGGAVTVAYSDAVEEALCFGWIDGHMQSIDDACYRRYFAPRRKHSNWSEKNKATAVRLENEGLMTAAGREKIDEAKQNGQWDKQAPAIGDSQVAFLDELLAAYEPAHSNFVAMPPSMKKTYARAYFDAKTDKGRASRIAWIVDRLNKNLKPM
jgi:uncharacterized protein YdeI (YjbR/CyaY-like superfamily)